MRRKYALLPLGLGLAALASGAQAASPASKPAQVAAGPVHKSHKGAKHHAAAGAVKGAMKAAPPVRNWGDFDVNEGTLGPQLPGSTCPKDMADVEDRFCIDRYEGALVEVLPDGREVPWPPFGPVDDSRTLRAISVPGVYPQAYISGAQAARACAASGKRLCAPVEWRAACMGPQQRTFGYGAARVSGRCNDSGQSPMLRLYPQVATSWTLVGMTEMNDPRLNQLDATLVPTGSQAECTNDYGVYDMVGNLHEWTNDPHGTFQGGYYLDTHKNGDGCTYRTVAHEFTYHDYSTGFRCCAPVAVP